MTIMIVYAISVFFSFLLMRLGSRGEKLTAWDYTLFSLISLIPLLNLYVAITYYNNPASLSEEDCSSCVELHKDENNEGI